ncbi:unnamed protein product, partial [Prorocentrum cordatum]
MAALASAGNVVVEAGALKDAQCPKLRFREPVARAIFFFGNAPESASADGEPPAEVTQPGPSAAHVHPGSAAETPEADLGARSPAPPRPDAGPDICAITGCRIRFPSLTNDRCPREIRAMVARLRCHRGRAGREDLRRFCAWQGATPAVYLAIHFLKCDACDRTRPPSRPEPISATIRCPGQFGEHLQADFLAIVDVAGTAHRMLGVICLDAHLRRVTRVADRLPEAAVAAFLEIIGGRPLADRGHQALQRHMEMDLIWDRTCDCCAAQTPGEVDVATVAVSDAKNSAVRRAARSANQCALGRTPRIPGELPSCDRGLAVAANAANAQHLVNGDYCRLEADIHTTHFNYEQQVGCWRNDAKKRPGGKSARPGFVIGAFLQWDGGEQGHGVGRNAWVRAGQTIELFSREQLRPAIGFAQWVPDPEDIEALESSCDLMRGGLWEGERGAGPQGGGLREEP